jgi:hypothetical protein
MGIYIGNIRTKHFQGPQFIGSNPQRVAAEPCPVCPWPTVSREKDNILASSAGCRGILYLPYVYLACVPIYVDKKRVLYWCNCCTNTVLLV